LLQIGRLKKSEPNLPVHILLTDVDPSLENEDRAKIELIIKKIIGQGTLVSWYSIIEKKFSRIIDRYAFDHELGGPSEELRKIVLDNLPNSSEIDKKGKLSEELWMKYIAWSTQLVKRFFIVTWAGDVIWRELFNLYNRDMLLLKRNTLCLGGIPGKLKNSPGENITISPPYYEETFNYIKKESDSSNITELIDHLNINNEISKEMNLNSEFYERHASYIDKLKESKSELSARKLELIHLLNNLNTLFEFQV